MAFLNPYHFVPVAHPRNGADDLPVQQLRNSAHVRHDRYVTGKHWGGVVCRLTTEDPIFVGDERTIDPTAAAPGVVSNFQVNGEPAIPASSLRGLISAIAEAASNSALRVLQNQPYSFRKPRTHHLSAIGM